MKKYKNIIWDWNGTIIDDVLPSLLAVNNMLTRKNMDEITIEQYYEYIDTPIINFYKNLFDAKTLNFAEITMDFDADYDRYLKEDPIMENVRTVMASFQNMNKNQVIISAANYDKVVKNAKRYNVMQYLNSVVAHHDFSAGDKIGMAVEYAKKQSINKDETIVIGDTLHDYKMAQALDCDCILTSKGHQGRKIIEQTDAVIIDNMIQVLNYIS